MLYNARNGKIEIYNTTIDYICFGKGKKNLIMIPGLGDGLKTVKGLALPFAYMYRLFAKDFRVYVFSRRNDLYENFSTMDMADDIAKSMDILNISKADFLGISQGGMIAECVAIKYPEKINKLVLAVTLAKSNSLIKENVNYWIERAKFRDYKSIFIDTVEKTYTEKYLRKYRKLYWLLSRIGAPREYSRFMVQANACLTHDVYDKLDKIENQTLIIGASNDKILGVKASEKMAKRIKNSELFIYDGYGHGVYKELRDFNYTVLEYLKK